MRADISPMNNNINIEPAAARLSLLKVKAVR